MNNGNDNGQMNQGAPGQGMPQQGAYQQGAYQQGPPQQQGMPGTPPPYGGQMGQQQYYGGQMGQPQYYGGEPPMTGIIEAYSSYWRNYANFNDRTSRAGYWWVILVNVIIETIMMAIFAMCAVPIIAVTSFGYDGGATLIIAMIIYWAWAIINIIPGLALTVRRLHDTGRSWVYILFYLIPIAGPIISIVFMATATAPPQINMYYYLPRQA